MPWILRQWWFVCSLAMGAYLAGMLYLGREKFFPTAAAATEECDLEMAFASRAIALGQYVDITFVCGWVQDPGRFPACTAVPTIVPKSAPLTCDSVRREETGLSNWVHAVQPALYDACAAETKCLDAAQSIPGYDGKPILR